MVIFPQKRNPAFKLLTTARSDVRGVTVPFGVYTMSNDDRHLSSTRNAFVSAHIWSNIWFGVVDVRLRLVHLKANPSLIRH